MSTVIKKAIVNTTTRLTLGEEDGINVEELFALKPDEVKEKLLALMDKRSDLSHQEVIEGKLLLFIFCIQTNSYPRCAELKPLDVRNQTLLLGVYPRLEYAVSECLHWLRAWAFMNESTEMIELESHRAEMITGTLWGHDYRRVPMGIANDFTCITASWFNTAVLVKEEIRPDLPWIVLASVCPDMHYKFGKGREHAVVRLTYQKPGRWEGSERIDPRVIRYPIVTTRRLKDAVATTATDAVEQELIARTMCFILTDTKHRSMTLAGEGDVYPQHSFLGSSGTRSQSASREPEEPPPLRPSVREPWWLRDWIATIGVLRSNWNAIGLLIPLFFITGLITLFIVPPLGALLISVAGLIAYGKGLVEGILRWVWMAIKGAWLGPVVAVGALAAFLLGWMFMSLLKKPVNVPGFRKESWQTHGKKDLKGNFVKKYIKICLGPITDALGFASTQGRSLKNLVDGAGSAKKVCRWLSSAYKHYVNPDARLETGQGAIVLIGSARGSGILLWDKPIEELDLEGYMLYALKTADTIKEGSLYYKVREGEAMGEANLRYALAPASAVRSIPSPAFLNKVDDDTTSWKDINLFTVVKGEIMPISEVGVREESLKSQIAAAVNSPTDQAKDWQRKLKHHAGRGKKKSEKIHYSANELKEMYAKLNKAQQKKKGKKKAKNSSSSESESLTEEIERRTDVATLEDVPEVDWEQQMRRTPITIADLEAADEIAERQRQDLMNDPARHFNTPEDSSSSDESDDERYMPDPVPITERYKQSWTARGYVPTPEHLICREKLCEVEGLMLFGEDKRNFYLREDLTFEEFQAQRQVEIKWNILHRELAEHERQLRAVGPTRPPGPGWRPDMFTRREAEAQFQSTWRNEVWWRIYIHNHSTLSQKKLESLYRFVWRSRSARKVGWQKHGKIAAFKQQGAEFGRFLAGYVSSKRGFFSANKWRILFVVGTLALLTLGVSLVLSRKKWKKQLREPRISSAEAIAFLNPLASSPKLSPSFDAQHSGVELLYGDSGRPFVPKDIFQWAAPSQGGSVMSNWHGVGVAAQQLAAAGYAGKPYALRFVDRRGKTHTINVRVAKRGPQYAQQVRDNGVEVADDEAQRLNVAEKALHRFQKQVVKLRATNPAAAASIAAKGAVDTQQLVSDLVVETDGKERTSRVNVEALMNEDFHPQLLASSAKSNQLIRLSVSQKREDPISGSSARLGNNVLVAPRHYETLGDQGETIMAFNDNHRLTVLKVGELFREVVHVPNPHGGVFDLMVIRLPETMRGFQKIPMSGSFTPEPNETYYGYLVGINPRDQTPVGHDVRYKLSSKDGMLWYLTSSEEGLCGALLYDKQTGTLVGMHVGCYPDSNPLSASDACAAVPLFGTVRQMIQDKDAEWGTPFRVPPGVLQGVDFRQTSPTVTQLG